MGYAYAHARASIYIHTYIQRCGATDKIANNAAGEQTINFKVKLWMLINKSRESTRQQAFTLALTVAFVDKR